MRKPGTHNIQSVATPNYLQIRHGPVVVAHHMLPLYRRLPFWEIGAFVPHGFEPWLSQTNDFNIDICHFLTRRLALLGVQCQDNVIEWDVRS